jgi:hypothetical protein
MRARLARSLRAGGILVRDEHVPRPIRWGGAFALMPIPGPVDEAVLVLICAVAWLFYRDRLRRAWGLADHAEAVERDGAAAE